MTIVIDFVFLFSPDNQTKSNHRSSQTDGIRSEKDNFLNSRAIQLSMQNHHPILK